MSHPLESIPLGQEMSEFQLQAVGQKAGQLLPSLPTGPEFGMQVSAIGQPE